MMLTECSCDDEHAQAMFEMNVVVSSVLDNTTIQGIQFPERTSRQDDVEGRNGW